jgi:acetyl esterase/lipase
MRLDTTVVLVTALALIALRPPMPRHSSPWNLQFALGYLINEQPFLGLYWLAAGSIATLALGHVGRVSWWLSILAVAVPAGLLVALALRARTARPALTAALRTGLGGCADSVEAMRTGIPWWRVLLLPFISYRFDVRRFRNQRYGDGGRGHLLDVYVNRRRPQGAPVLIYLHGGGFRIGSKMLGGRPLVYRLASRGWVCVSANYRLSRRATYTDRVTDVKRVIAWVRNHGEEYGADPSTLILAGGSAGAHLAATAALTPGDIRFQPGFEEADTSATAVVAMYGYYGPTQSADGMPTSPLEFLHAEAPPFFIIHGTLDTLVLVRDARHFADELGRASSRPVIYAELPGTQHNFDFFHSLRFHAVTDAIESFLIQVHAPT